MEDYFLINCRKKKVTKPKRPRLTFYIDKKQIDYHVTVRLTCGLIEQESIEQAAYEWHHFWTKFTNKRENEKIATTTTTTVNAKNH
ncbi:hypothetical protein BpHYR1_011756 [Brachionus plicatilis]|uniref:Uncharacterized protein n=1 Tax=Brachionus plicatilis TaxID=10195 RepID=A0A3M7P9A7_BRAPC|nr:hypothetical protein BpHYR1_011756 [Brachionus plicatilis]